MTMPTHAHSASADEAGPSTPRQVETSSWIPRLLIIDHDDSYTLNILVTLLHAIKSSAADQNSIDDEALAARLLARTLVVRHTDSLLADSERVQREVLPHFDAVILSPGPGRPEVKGDFGAAASLLEDFRDASRAASTDNPEPCIPTLGVCLGHQGIATAFGGKVKRARHLRHGLSSHIEVQASSAQCRWPSLFEGLAARHATMTTYNSLIVDEASLPADVCVTAVANDEAPLPSNARASDAERVVMALQHVNLPLWGVQFHPESIESKDGVILLRNFLAATKEYWLTVSQSNTASTAATAQRRLSSWRSDEGLPGWLQAHGSRRSSGIGAPARTVMLNDDEELPFRISMRKLGKLPASRSVELFENLFGQGDWAEPAVWLDSARPGGKHSRFSYMAQPAWTVTYDCTSGSARLKKHKRQAEIEIKSPLGKAQRRPPVDVHHGLATPSDSRTPSPVQAGVHDAHDDAQLQGLWAWLNAIQQSLQELTSMRASEPGNAPFCGGFVGYFGYEMKKESIARQDVNDFGSFASDSDMPTASFGFCDRILVIDHELGEISAVGLLQNRPDQSTALRKEDAFMRLEQGLTRIDATFASSPDSFDEWCSKVRSALDCIYSEADGSINREPMQLPSLKPVDSRESYIAKVEKARELIAQGQSYELCLTTEFQGRVSDDAVKDGDVSSAHFDIYCHLRQRNPAPFSAFIKLDGERSILSTSPEKFMSIDAQTGLVEMKPIKGTSARAGYGKEAGEGVMLERARKGDAEASRNIEQLDERRQNALQMDAKERAENLMIVDLIRRDILGFCSPETVTVPKLMAIESYETVHQLVTTVHGQKPPSVGCVEALARCFPPGSMTGAPKVRSVQLLDALEADQDIVEGVRRRAGRGVYSGILGWIGIDGSASFNVLIRTVVAKGRDISVGAGGAITYLSSAERELQEVLEKVGAIADVNQ